SVPLSNRVTTSSPTALSFPLTRCDPPRHLHSFPTRRSSDLAPLPRDPESAHGRPPAGGNQRRGGPVFGRLSADGAAIAGRERDRSEEHTSELQSRGHLVCRLRLEKKNHLPHRLRLHPRLRRR